MDMDIMDTDIRGGIDTDMDTRGTDCIQNNGIHMYKHRKIDFYVSINIKLTTNQNDF
jgi:hypothetical protein